MVLSVVSQDAPEEKDDGCDNIDAHGKLVMLATGRGLEEYCCDMRV